MKNLRIKFIAGMGLLALLSHSAGAQWVQTNGPARGQIRSFTASNGFLFVGTYLYGVFRSQDNGISWTAANNGIPANTTISCLAAGNGTLYAGSSSDIYLSLDNGTSWTSISSGLTNPAIRAIGVNDSFVVIGTNGTGMYRSSDSGANWTQCNTGLSNTTPMSLAVCGNLLFVGDTGISISTNNGSIWADVNNGIPFNSTILSLMIDNGVVFAGTYENALRSVDSGQNWTVINNGLPEGPVYYDGLLSFAALSDTIYTGTVNGYVFFSVDTGNSWNEITNDLSGSSTNCLARSNDTLFAGTSHGFFYSVNNGVHWFSACNGLPVKTYIQAIIAFNGYLFAGDRSYGVSRTADEGATWFSANTGLPHNCDISCFVEVNDSIFAGTEYGIFLSIDSGNSWVARNNGLTDTIVNVLAVSDSCLFAGCYDRYMQGKGVFLSTDRGLNWTQVNNGLSDTNVWALTAGNGKVLAGTSYSGVFLSTDNGANWSAINNGLTDLEISSLLIKDSLLFAGASDGGGVFLSSDSGSSWTAMNNGIPTSTGPYYPSILNFTVKGDTIFMLTRGKGVFLSTDNGANWDSINTGLLDTAICLAVTGNNIFAGTNGNGVWRLSLSGTGVNNHTSQNPAGVFKVSIPARSNNTIAISFSLVRPEQVTVKIYKLSGHEIATLVNTKLASGPHQLRWDTRSLATGCYAVRMQAGSNVYVKSIPVFR